MQVLILRLDAPLMAFGEVSVDELRPAAPFPPLSMMVGLLANAMGWKRWEPERHQRLQERLRMAARIDRQGASIRDFQTVDLTQPHLKDTGWTTRGMVEVRGGGTVHTHIRLRDYWADRVATLALGLDPEAETPTLDDLEQGLIRPARPLFVGRKSCIPSTPLVIGRIQSDSLLQVLAEWPRDSKAIQGPMRTRWSETTSTEQSFAAYDLRDWRNQIHTGERRVTEGLINPLETHHE